MIACSDMAFALARVQPLYPEAKGRGSLWVSEGQYLGHSTTSNQ